MAGTWQWLEVLLEKSVKLQHGSSVPGKFLVCSVLRARPLQKSCVTERCDSELCWSSGEKQICVMHLFNGLDLKTGLSPPEGFEVANRKLSQASGCPCGVVLVQCSKWCWHWWHLSGVQGTVGLMPSRARAGWEPPGVPLASTSGGNILQDEQSINAAPKTSPLQSGVGGNHCRFSTWLLRHKLSPGCWQIF